MSEPTLLDRLKDPFDPKFIKWRVGATNKEKTKGIALAYIDAREVMKRLDSVCGFDNWQKKTERIDGGFTCSIGIRINGEWVWKDDAAGETHVEPIKGGASDAFKRAAAVWGVGRYLYYLPNIWVAIEAQGNSYKLAELPELPHWAMPNKEIASWEAIAEQEATADTQGADEQVTDTDDVMTFGDAIKNAETPADITVILSSADPAMRRALTGIAQHRLEELKNGTQSTAGN